MTSKRLKQKLERACIKKAEMYQIKKRRKRIGTKGLVRKMLEYDDQEMGKEE